MTRISLGAFWLAITCALSAGAALAEDLLEPEQAFRLSARAIDDANLSVEFKIARGYYLYRKNFAFVIESPADAVLGEPVYVPGKMKDDAIFGRTEIYRDAVAIRLPIKLPAGASGVALRVTSQGCSDIGICYPPQHQRVKVSMDASLPTDAQRSFFGNPPSSASVIDSQGREPSPSEPPSEPEGIARLLAGASLWLVVATFLGFGVLLAFTPCMLPMIPILSGIVVGHGAHTSKWRGALLSAAYVLGMALTYTVLGVAAGLSGTLLSAAMQKPWVLASFAAVFVVLALGMFGAFRFQMPQAWQSTLAQTLQRVPGGTFTGVFLMGALSAVIVGPCVAAPLAGALLYIGQSRDVIFGGTALFALAIGMGLPLIAVGASASVLLPKAGPWMQGMQRFFGIVLLGVAIWIAAPVTSAGVQMLLWAALAILSGVFLRALDPLPTTSGDMARLGKATGVALLLLGAAWMVGALSGGDDMLRPLAGLRSTASAQTEGSHLPFDRVKSVAELESRLTLARSSGQPVMLDFYADWCVSCKEMERFTFSDPRVRRELAGMVLLQADVTRNDDQDVALLRRFKLFGPPGIVFFDATGRETPERVVGYQDADRFLATIARSIH